MKLYDFAFTAFMLLVIGSVFLLVSEAPEKFARFTIWTLRAVSVVAYVCALYALIRCFML